MINITIGKHKITRLIGEGGMASVYEAEHEMLGTKVAIKVLNPILSANAQIKERFRNEAKLMASLDHPNITKVIDFDEQPQQLSIVMEFLQGEDLNQKIKRSGALNEEELIEIFSQTLSAFHYAHVKGIVHRDIKPSNIFILPNGMVKILDFGIAKLFGQGNELTQTGTQMGTPVYMSPEQVKADKSIDHRSDIYSLGVTMFYSINGKPPYSLDTHSQFDIFNKIVFEPLPEIKAPGYLNEIIKKACSKERNNRFQNCDEWINALKSKSNLHSSAHNIKSDTAINPDKTILESAAMDSTSDISEKLFSSGVPKKEILTNEIEGKNLNNSISTPNTTNIFNKKPYVLFKIIYTLSFFYFYYSNYGLNYWYISIPILLTIGIISESFFISKSVTKKLSWIYMVFMVFAFIIASNLGYNYQFSYYISAFDGLTIGILAINIIQIVIVSTPKKQTVEK
jgi:serine/threonine protein kinase